MISKVTLDWNTVAGSLLTLISWMRTICMVNSIAAAVATVASARGTRMNGCKEEVRSHNSNFISHIHEKVSGLSEYSNLLY